jgi:glycosyltransferase involved in cell wall biosynthesis
MDINNSKPKISIICPVYNAESYLHRCIDSVLCQTFKDFELLLIDDGSIDCSLKLCNDYAEKDKRIRVFHKDNGGVASARQMGVDNMRGEFSIHLDPDDWIDSDMLESMYNAIIQSGAEMLICDFLVERQGPIEYRKQNPEKLTADSVLYGLFNGNVHGSLCNKLIKTQLYKKFSVHFIKGLNCCEDLMINLQLLKNGIKVDYLPKAFYHYDQFSSNQSLTRIDTDYDTLLKIITNTSLILKDNINYEYLLYRQKLFFKRRLLAEQGIDFKTYKNAFPEIKSCCDLRLFKLSLIDKVTSYKYGFNLFRFLKKIRG